MDALSSATAELEKLRAQLNAETLLKEEKQPKKTQKQKNKPGQVLEAGLQCPLMRISRIVIYPSARYCGRRWVNAG